MQFLVMVEMTPAVEAGLAMKKEAFEAMGAFNETLAREAEIMTMGGLKPSAHGVRIDYSGAKPAVIDGPFTESKELVGGFWLLEAPSREALVERFLSCPFMQGESLEIRPLWSMEELTKML